ncbi:DNA recombination protein RmuC [Calidifontimicrobium sp. SYSU G02091]|uniref:DNA recombination protein RmuC n=1 Tax=Calidifontimicrobium sp. SYSU G02091 TaxID=2926421 RepID=UPI001F53C3E0|nr:DNA recombination protein RmuC [Calidifontimicrobium sp. SYSU G02091]MCI1191958.1 DNA recombination protein RmuC [Calidifontimicrobium sp. SYSU G02091]
MGWALLALAAVTLVVVAWLAWRRGDDAALRALGETLRRAAADDAQQLARELRGEVADSARTSRQELAGTLALFQQTLLAQSGDVARTQNEQIDTLRTQLAAMQQQVADALHGATQALAQQSQAARDAQDAALARQAEQQSQTLQRVAEQQAQALQRMSEQQAQALQRLGDTLAEQLRALAESNERRLADMRQTVEGRLQALQQGNEAKLEQMRATVDEKLHATLEQRLGESFRQVAERLELVHQGLGEMQSLARDVGSLNRVLTNVKTRGVFGEVQLGALLEQVMAPDQYAANVETVPGSGARVEFAIKLPGRRDDGRPLWLPIDAKFPREDYERLLDAHERADAAGVDAASKAIEARLRLEAKTIREKYVAAPHTTDFAILFVPTEGLYAEALRRPGLVESLQREQRVTLAGPTTLLATLSSLQMGFRTLALEKRSAEVWQVLGAVKTEFAKFGDVLAKTKKKLDEASATIDAAEVRTRVMARQLKTVEALPEAQAQQLLGTSAGERGADDAPHA